MKTVIAIPPYTHIGRQVFKVYAYNAWEQIGGKVARCHYPPRFLHGLAYNCKLPHLYDGGDKAHLRFVQPYSLYFDTFPEYITNEIIPLFWDVWPNYFEDVCVWLKKMNVRTAIFTSSQTADRVKEKFPNMNILAITEGIDTNIYKKGKLLKNRNIDLLEYGRKFDHIVRYELPDNFNHYKLRGQKNGKLLHSQDQLFDNLADAKTVIMLPRCITDPELAGDIETLTQRYWEGMLSRAVLIGQAPKELIDLIGYNPVIELDKKNPNSQIIDILSHIEDYQELVDKNREMALEFGDWENRMKEVKEWLITKNYSC